LETNDGSIMLDFGPSAPLRMAQENLDWFGLDAIWISHFHLDHCGGLAPFLFATRRAPETQGRTKPLHIYGSTGLQRLIENFDKANDYKLFDQPFPVEIVEVEPLERFELIPGVGAIAIKTPHTAESQAIRIEDSAGFTIVYTSDTGFGKEIATLALDTDLFIIESSFFRDKKTEKHLELAEAMYLVRKAKPKRAMLTHFYAEWDAVDFVKEITVFEPACEVLEAFDGLRLDLS